MNLPDDQKLTSIASVLAMFQAITKIALGGGIFIIIVWQIKLDPVMAGVLGAYAGATYSDTSGILNFFFGSSQSGKNAAASLAQIAGAGAPPPSPPSA